MVANAKPEPDVYIRCLEIPGAAADIAVAIEDSDSGMASALAAGVTCVALPGLNTSNQDLAGRH
jgi:HAD superfamily hydrolase (TIGR01509 family)